MDETTRDTKWAGDLPSMNRLRVVKRVVPVRIRLADDSLREGHLYGDVQRLDGGPATILDRLDDPCEAFLPLATGGTHVLVSKSRAMTVEIRPGEITAPATQGATTLQVEILLSNGEILNGRIHAVLPPASCRALDFLNRLSSKFLCLFRDDEAVLVNREYVVAVTEVRSA